MSELHSQSPAFQQALRQSERLRIYLLLALLAFILVLRGTRTVLAPTPDNIATLYMSLSLISVLGAIELITLRMLHQATQQAKPMPRGFCFVNIFLEIAPPAVSIASAASSVIQPGYRPLANPSFLIYFLLLMLTILRLDPPLSVPCEFFAARTYPTPASHLLSPPLQPTTHNSPY